MVLIVLGGMVIIKDNKLTGMVVLNTTITINNITQEPGCKPIPNFCTTFFQGRFIKKVDCLELGCDFDDNADGVVNKIGSCRGTPIAVHCKVGRGLSCEDRLGCEFR